MERFVALGQGGKIVKVDWGGVNRNGDDKAYDGWQLQYVVWWCQEWWEQAEKVEQHLIKTQDPAKIKYSNNDGSTDGVWGDYLC